MNIGKHISIALVILLCIHHTQSLGGAIHERMLNSPKHSSPTTTQAIPQNTVNDNEELLEMDEIQFKSASYSADTFSNENIQTTSTSSNGYCSQQSLSYGSNSNNIDTSINEYSWLEPHSTNATTSAPTPQPTQIEKTWKYSVILTNTSSTPVISWIKKTSSYQQVFNPSWVQSSDYVWQPGILAQVQNCSLIPGQCKMCNKTSGLVFTTCNPEKNSCRPLGAPSGKVPYTSPMPGTKNPLNGPIFRNPSIFYWRDLFYMFVNDLDDKDPNNDNYPNETDHNYIKLYTKQNPTNSSGNWTKHDGAFSTEITAPAALLSMNNLTNLKYSNDDGIHWLFYGGQGHISVTNSCSPLSWEHIDTTPWLQPRPDHFDKDGVETGPAPIKLMDGNYLMLYNGYAIQGRRPPTMIVPHQIKHYEVGWVILDGKDPRRILQRSDKPLITATYAYENGDPPYTCAQQKSVYAKAIVPLESSSNETHQTFRVYFSAADTSVGSAVISISYASLNNEKQTEWMTIAIVVSIACGVFVVVMFLVIWCKNKDTGIVDLTTDPEYISIASAKYSKEISGTNHNGTPYVIGSLDRKRRQLMNGINDGSRIERQSVYSSHHSPRGHEHGHHGRKHHKHRRSRREKDGYQKKSRRKSVRKYETNGINPNHVHIHTTDCYDEEDDSRDCQFLNVNVNVENMNIHSSLNSNISTNSSSTTSSSSTSSSSCTSSSGSRTMDSPSTSSTTASSSYCSHCHGKYHEVHDKRNNRGGNNHFKSPSKTQTGTQRDMSQSETMRLSQISFRINETMEKDSPTFTGGNLITIDGYNPTTTQFSFYDRTNLNLGEKLIQHERQ